MYVWLFFFLLSLYFPPHSSPFISWRPFLPVKILVPKEVTLGWAPAPVLNFWVALLQLAGENHSKTISCGSLYDQHYLNFKHLHLETPCLWGTNISQWFQLTRKLLSPAALCGSVKGVRSSPRWPEDTTYGQEEKMLSNTWHLERWGEPGQLLDPGEKPSSVFL